MNRFHRSEPLSPHDPAARGWGRAEAAHLLRRASFGPTADEISAAAEGGMEAAIERLLTPARESPSFQATDSLLRQAALDSGDIDALKAWWLHRLFASANPLVEKLTLMWHNHFATSHAKVRSVPLMANQNDLLRRHAVGRFDELLPAMARDPAMLIWLDGSANRKRRANENFARELMELFSLGVDGGYTEVDVAEAARAFTGWSVRDAAYWFDSSQHDRGAKTVLGATGEFGGDDVVRLCLGADACPRFLATKLLRTFVADDPAPEWIDQVAGRIRAHAFDMLPVMRELLSWDEFHGDAARAAIIKSPVELVIGALRSLEAASNLAEAAGLLAALGHSLFEPPTVKGWEGGRLWINSTALILRANFASELAHGDRFGAIADPASLAARGRWTSARQAVDHYAELLLARPLDEPSRRLLIDDFAGATGGVGGRLRQLVHLITVAPEFQLM